ncbi:MAG: hypothetical protein GX285_03455 [Clostridiales bacterium]|nr:hypothetical protein [Clostridiales bacterium]
MMIDMMMIDSTTMMIDGIDLTDGIDLEALGAPYPADLGDPDLGGQVLGDQALGVHGFGEVLGGGDLVSVLGDK